MDILLPEKQNHFLVFEVNAKAMGIVRVFSQEHEGKMVAGKNKDVSPLLCSASSINQLQLHVHIEV